MPYNLDTYEDKPLASNIEVRASGDPYVLTAEFTVHSFNQFRPEDPFYTAPVTSNGTTLTISLSVDEVNFLQDAYYRIRAVKTGTDLYIESGKLRYHPLPAKVEVRNDDLILIDSSGSEYDAGSVRGPKGDKGDTGPVGPQGPIGNTGPQGPASPVASVVGQTGAVTGAQIANDPAVKASFVSPTQATTLYSPLTTAVPRSVGSRIFDQDLKIITAFQSGHGYTNLNGSGGESNNLNDTSDFVLGSQAVKLTTSGTSGYSTAAKLAQPTIDFTGRQPAILFKADDLTKVAAIQLYMGSSSLANRFSWNLEPALISRNSQRWSVSGDWAWVTFPWSNAGITGTPNRAAITDIQVRVQDNGDGPMTARFNAVGHIKQPVAWPNGVVTFSFDDSEITQFTVAKPYMDRYGYGGTAFVITERCLNGNGSTDYFTTTQAHQMEDKSGWEVGYHAYSNATHTATYTGIPQTDLMTDVRLARQWLITEGFKAAEHLAYPKGIYDAPTLGLLRPHFRTARGNIIGTTAETVLPADPMRLRMLNLQPTDPVSVATNAIDAAFTGGHWLIFAFHQLVTTPVGGQPQYSITGFQQIVDYCATKGIPVRTTSEVMRTRVN